MSYDNLTTRSAEPRYLSSPGDFPSHGGTSDSQWLLFLKFISIFIFILSSFSTAAAVLFHVFAYFCDKSTGHHSPGGAYFSLYTIVIFIICGAHMRLWSTKLIFILASAAITWSSNRSIRDAWLAARRAAIYAPSARLLSFLCQHDGFGGLCSPDLYLFVVPCYYLAALISISLEPFRVVLSILFFASLVFFLLLSQAQYILLRPSSTVMKELESQKDVIFEVSHKQLFLQGIEKARRMAVGTIKKRQ